MAKVTMPQLGESVAEGTIGKWLKQPGDHVAKYEPLLEVITDKVNAEVPSPFEGVLKEILAEEGATVPNNAEIAIIETADDGAADAAAATGPVVTPTPAAAARARRTRDGHRPGPAGSDETNPAPTTPAQPTAPAAARRRARRAARAGLPRPRSRRRRPRGDGCPAADAGDPDARMTPAVRRLLREHGLTAAQIVGTGGGGRITRDDVLAVVETIRTGGAVPVPRPARRAAPATHQRLRPPPGSAQAPAPAQARPRPHRPRGTRGSSSPRAPTKSCCR